MNKDERMTNVPCRKNQGSSTAQTREKGTHQARVATRGREHTHVRDQQERAKEEQNQKREKRGDNEQKRLKKRKRLQERGENEKWRWKHHPRSRFLQTSPGIGIIIHPNDFHSTSHFFSIYSLFSLLFFASSLG